MVSRVPSTHNSNYGKPFFNEYAEWTWLQKNDWKIDFGYEYLI